MEEGIDKENNERNDIGESIPKDDDSDLECDNKIAEEKLNFILDLNKNSQQHNFLFVLKNIHPLNEKAQGGGR